MLAEETAGAGQAKESDRPPTPWIPMGLQFVRISSTTA